ncbi:MAG: glycosyltransferase family 9 protein [Proteobacteria bacterium]|nr:glycosyltransferase family 9 protein [Pseudomonadota bacterium]
MKILLIQLRQLGDILLTTPAIRSVRKRHPECTLHVLTHSMGKLILADNPFLDEHIVLPSKGLSENLNFLRRLRKERYDICVDFMCNPRSSFLSIVTQAPRRIGFETRRSLAYTECVPRLSGSDYIAIEKFRILKDLTTTEQDIRLDLPFAKKDSEIGRKFVHDLVSETGSTFVVCLSPTHRRDDRKWPPGHWVTMADHLALSFNAIVVWLWGPGELEEVKALQERTKLKTYLAPKTSFRELAGLIAQCQLFIGNSNGPSHVSVAVNTPSIQLHGPTDAPSWCPNTPRHRFIQSPSRQMDMDVSTVINMVEKVRSETPFESASRFQIFESLNVSEFRPQL